MTEVKNERPKLSVRTGASRKLLERKALEKAQDAQGNEPALEDSFPVADGSVARANDVELAPDPMAGGSAPFIASPEDAGSAGGNTLPLPLDSTQEPASASPEAIAAAPAPQPPSHIAWSSEDESLFQTLLSRRKGAGHKRSREIGDQRLCAGTITPNPKTVVAVIVALVAEHGSLTRDELVAKMASASFPHPKAQPKDPIWCKGYVAGAIRNGFLAVASEVAQAEAA